MSFKRHHKFVKCYAVVICAWIVVFVAIQFALFDFLPFSLFGRSLILDRGQLQMIMLPKNYSDVLTDPLLAVLSPDQNFVHFYHLPKRMYLQYNEITSANRDSRFPLAPDFTFHINYIQNEITIYEDYGEGCIYRLYLYPALPTDYEVLHRMTASDLSGLFIVLEVDSMKPISYSLKQMAQSTEWPFLYPLSARHPTVASGIGTYLPICYKESIRIVYRHNENFPENLLNLTVNCTYNELRCPVKIYSAVSRHKFPLRTNSDVISDQIVDLPIASVTEKQDKVEHHLSRVADLLMNPEQNGPDAGVSCQLTCVELCPNCQRVIHHKISTAGVISSFRLRIFDANSHLILPDWNQILLSIYFDDLPSPQIDRVPIGSLFGATGSLNTLRGAAFGKTFMHCSYSDYSSSPRIYNAVTGYFHLPMPYWREVMFVVDATEHLSAAVKFCFQVNEVDNYYSESDTGYLHAIKTYYSGDVSGWRNVLNVTGGFGQLVSLSMEVDNLRAVRDAPLMYRWAALQADSLIYIDDSQAPTVLGTGLEDYFSYAHGFSGAENTTYSFVGVHHSGPKQLEPLTWHCYRQHILDPVTFQNSLTFVMEGTDAPSRYMHPVEPLNYSQHLKKRASQETTIAHLALYYYRQHPRARGQLCDEIQLGNVTSEQTHSFQITHNISANSGKIFATGPRVRYLGDTTRDRTFSLVGRSFDAGDRFRFRLVIDTSTEKSAQLFVLRRTFQWVSGLWNSRAKLSVNGLDKGVLFVPMGSMSDEYSLQTNDVSILADGRQKIFEITIEPVSNSWRDISYRLCTVV